MRNLNFKKIKASNFLCFGESGVELDLESLDNIVLIKGINHDVVGENGKFSSNGSGKSSIPECIVYALYGKTIKSPKKISHKDVINNKYGKKLSVDLYFDNYKITRSRKPDSLRVWKSEKEIFDESTEITLGGMPATQELIDNIVGLSYESFLNVCVFTDDNGSSFLELEPAEKRKVIENLLNLEKYRKYLETAKLVIKENKDNVKSLNHELSLLDVNKSTLENNVKTIENNIQTFKQNLKLEISKIEKQIESLKDQIQDSNYEEELEEYKKAVKKIEEIKNALKEISSKKNGISIISKKIVSEVQEKMFEKQKAENSCSSVLQDIKNINSAISKIDDKIEKFKNLKENVVCDKCFGVIKPENYKESLKQAEEEKQKQNEFLNDKNKELENEKDDLQKKTKILADANISLKKIEEFNDKLYQQEETLNSKLNDLEKINKPEQSDNDLIINEKIKVLQESIETKQKSLEEDSPYQELLDKNKNDLDTLLEKIKDIKSSIKSFEELIPYYDFWTEAFGDDGIRKIVIDEIVPALNSKLEYWLQILIDNKLHIVFDDGLAEAISKDPNKDKELIYSVLSNGQKRRINLAVNQAFAHLMMLSHGVSPSLVFLDEVTTNIDQIGVQGIYNMICELSKEKKVFVTTHDADLLSLLYGCQTVTLEMKNGETKIV
jgi:DNA repair exonuclease SbcCD ATPase subunit